jgi:RHH-type proline utilization regulon transcriptional repressor/proline dehydrogenase/delta 1-pyrroline-5-carboxylate dehydrogenase
MPKKKEYPLYLSLYKCAMSHHFASPHSNLSPFDAARLGALYTADEAALTKSLALALQLNAAQRTHISERAGKWVSKVRAETHRTGVIDAFLQEYGLSTNEGIILMRLSEALIRTPDFATAQELMRDKLGAGEWNIHAGSSPATLINAATTGLRFSAAWIAATGGSAAARLAAKLGDRVLYAAVVRGMRIMAGHFVLGKSIADAVQRAESAEKKGVLHSFDMLGEAATTERDAQNYYDAYAGAVRYLAGFVGDNATVATAHGLSVKLSALHPRYEYAKRASCVPALIDKISALALIAKEAGVGLTLDAEEADRLELSLHIFTALLNDPRFVGWDGLGIVVQAYQRRATATIEIVVDAAKAANRQIAIRLVKGAYWDAEIKRAQELGIESYPVFTRKENTDISYLACAAQLLNAGPLIFPQFATHNAHTAAAIIEMAQGRDRLEFQRLHGMGEALHNEIVRETGIRSRVYAPVGNHKELLPYLVRRLLENGANSSFVNQLMNPEIEVDEIVRDPIVIAQDHGFSAHPAIPAPRDLFGGERQSALGIDLTQSSTAKNAETSTAFERNSVATSLVSGAAAGSAAMPVYSPADSSLEVGRVVAATNTDINNAIAAAKQSRWHVDTTPQMRADCLLRVATLLEERMRYFMALCVAEAGKTLPDAVAEIREAVDFCRYYAGQAVSPRMAQRLPLGVVACVSPWNFPLAIFLGQVTAALAAGNTVVAKPAVQTPLIAHAAVTLLHEAGVPVDALHLIIGGGDVGGALVGNSGVDSVCFTGSTATAKRIASARADVGRADSVLIAETGGINAMIIDSTALLEQAVGDVVSSAFQSAGQRCSACRLVCIQEDIADDFETMLAGAIALLELGNPALLVTDVGPIIDQDARRRIAAYVEAARVKFRVIGEAPSNADLPHGHFIQPIALGVNSISDVSDEIFGPVLHVVRFAADDIHSVVDQINALGYGLTLGVHSRIDARIKSIVAQAKVGNLYVNRNQIGAVVGVQPFGGEGLSGTGPKAGGPHYLLRLSQTKAGKAAQCIDEKSTAAATGKSADPESMRKLSLLIATSRKAQKKWVKAERLAISNAIAGTAFSVDALVALHNTSALPGPTGEENSLQLVPRGVLLCCGGDDPDVLHRQIAIAIASGCAVLAVAAPEIERVVIDAQAILVAADIPSTLITTIDAGDVGSALHSDIDGVVADGSLRGPLAKLLTRRTGAIIPLLSSTDDPERYFHERTLTIDTTAAGGNASLLAMSLGSGLIDHNQ